MYSQVIAEEQKDHDPAKRINIFSLAPGFVETSMQKMIRKTKHKDFKNVGKKTINTLEINLEKYDEKIQS